MRVIGLTGGLGTGKSTVAKMFSGLGAKGLDADRIAHQVMVPGTACFRKILRVFGQNILTNGRIDRRKMARRVFGDPGALRKLEQIIHPEVRKVILAKIKEYKKCGQKTVVVIDVPLLFEVNLDRHVDVSIVVKSSKMKQVARATKLLNITKAEAERRIKAQMPLQKKIRLADLIIDNNGTIHQTKKQVKQIWEKL